MNQSILVTGDLGVIGSIICPRLNAMGFRIEGYDLRRGENILNTQHLTEKLKDKYVCIHLAGIPGPSDDSWEKFEEQNIQGTKSVIQACQNVKVKRLVYMSSGAVYGFSRVTCIPDRLPIREDNKLPNEDKLCYYDITKIECEKHLKEVAEDSDLTTIALRMDTPYPPISVIETHFFVSISHDNLVEAFRASLQSDFKGYGVFNIADPYIHPSVNLDIQEWIKKRWPDVPSYTKGRESLFDISKAREILGYNPK